ncbi:MAG TPA: hypothetical protein VG733_17490 [Chthoniobacteraceae bacterium]|nr:hypothetical protein [Chthoniobacteraceae bacterium]
MTPRPAIEKILYAFAIAVILAVLLLVACSPSYFMSGKIVYQGF